MSFQRPNVQRLLFPVAAAFSLTLAICAGAQAADRSRSAWWRRCPGQSALRRGHHARPVGWPSTRSTPRAACWAGQARTGAPRRRKQPAKGVVAARELIFKEKVARAVRRARHAGVDGHRALANQEKVPFMGPGPRAPDHQNGANPNYAFRVSAVDELVDVAHAGLRAEDAQGEEARHDPGQQPVGRVEREGPASAALAAKGMKAGASRSSRAATSTWCRSSRA
jgi:branched-chain amino acid transport system substrate-binding protein